MLTTGPIRPSLLVALVKPRLKIERRGCISVSTVNWNRVDFFVFV